MLFLSPCRLMLIPSFVPHLRYMAFRPGAIRCKWLPGERRLFPQSPLPSFRPAPFPQFSFCPRIQCACCLFSRSLPTFLKLANKKVLQEFNTLTTLFCSLNMSKCLSYFLLSHLHSKPSTYNFHKFYSFFSSGKSAKKKKSQSLKILFPRSYNQAPLYIGKGNGERGI